MYIHAPESRSRLIVEVAHPVADLKTLELGLELFRATDAAGLFVAGAHRDAGSNDSADVAHNPRTVFEAVHGAAVEAEWIVLQPHGFEEARRPDRFGDMVISSGSTPTDLTRSLAERLTVAGFDVCLFGRDRCEGWAGLPTSKAVRPGAPARSSCTSRSRGTSARVPRFEHGSARRSRTDLPRKYD
jgi:hypothetical protein